MAKSTPLTAEQHEIISELCKNENLNAELFRYAYRVTNSRQNAEDALQNTWLIAIRKIEQFSDVPEDCRRLWLYSVLRREAYKRRCWRPWLTLFGDQQLLEPSVPPTSNLIKDEERVQLASAMSRLNPKEREILTLRLESDLTHAQIAELMGCKPESARLRFHRAKEKLATLVQQTSRNYPDC